MRSKPFSSRTTPAHGPGRQAMTDFNGVVAEYVYKTDDIILPEDAQAFQFPDTEKYGWMPELVGGEWIKEDEE